MILYNRLYIKYEVNISFFFNFSFFHFSRFAFILREGEERGWVRRVHEEEDVEDDLRRLGRQPRQHQRGHLHQKALRKVPHVTHVTCIRTHGYEGHNLWHTV